MLSKITREYNQQKCPSFLTGRHPRPGEFNSFKATSLLQCLRLPLENTLQGRVLQSLTWPQLMREK